MSVYSSYKLSDFSVFEVASPLLSIFMSLDIFYIAMYILHIYESIYVV